MGYIAHDLNIKHDGGTHNLEVEIDGQQAVIRFGSSFTLRIAEDEVWKLRDILHDTGRDMEANRLEGSFA